MIGDRHYMRDSSRYSARPLSIRIIILLVTLFTLQNAFVFLPHPSLARWEWLLKWFGLSQNVLAGGRIWQLLTFQFLHAILTEGGFWHIFFNCLSLYFFGPAVDAAMSRKQFLLLYLGGGACGGLFQALGHFVLPENFGLPVVGASAGIAAVIAAFAFLFPGQIIMVMGILPVPAKFFFIFAALYAVFGIMVPSGGGGMAHGAHLGGLLAGWAYVRWVLNSTWEIPKLRWPGSNKRVIISTNRSTFGKARPMTAGDVPAEEFISKEVDPILDKITKHGIHSLTEAERKTLEAARARMAKR
jgi:membrane associated rhomboid family serine protease